MVVILGFTAWSVDFWHGKRDGARAAEGRRRGRARRRGVHAREPERHRVLDRPGGRDARTDTPNGVNGVDRRRGARASSPTSSRSRSPRPCRTIFGSAIGVRIEPHVRARASAEYQRPVSMGSPINQFGNDPTIGAISHGSTRYPDFWTNVFGPSSNKGKGDAIQSTICDGVRQLLGLELRLRPERVLLRHRRAGVGLTAQRCRPSIPSSRTSATTAATTTTAAT